MKIIVKTLHGLEEVLAQEIRDLGGADVQLLKRAVSFEGDKRLLYRANLELHTALRVLVHMKDFIAKTPEELYKKIRRIEWLDYLDVDQTFAIDATATSGIFRHSKYAALKVKDAVADYFRQKTGRRPDVNVDYPHLRINLHINEDKCSLSLDSSGDSLHKRGYRANTLEAPLNEVLAAGMILLSGWRGDSTFVDPMCGSGTLLIEAALIANNIPPQLHRKETFGFTRWNNYDAKLWADVIEQAKANIHPQQCEIVGFDKDRRAVRITEQNIFSAYLDSSHIKVARSAFEKLEPPPPPGVILMNPPYDERLEQQEIDEFYKMIGDVLKQQFAGYEAWIISSNMEAMKFIGLRPSRRITLYNGALECKFQGYEMYEGSKENSEVGTGNSEEEFL